MADFINHLQHRIKLTKVKLQETNDTVQRLMIERAQLEADLQGYERTLAAEMRAEGMTPAVAAMQLPLNGSDRESGDDGGMTKAEFARQFIREHADVGATPADLFKGFQEARISITKPYVYSLVQRLRKQTVIRQRRGKWFPVPESERSQVSSGQGD